MKMKRGLFVVVLIILSVLAVSASTLRYGRMLGTYLGYEENVGYTFFITEGLSTRILIFGENDEDKLLKRYDFKNDESLINASFMITYDSSLNEDTGGVELQLISLKKVSSFNNFLEEQMELED